MLLRRMPPDCRKDILGMKVDAVGLVQTDLPNLFYLADVGAKAGSVSAVELHGTCPQHINTIGFWRYSSSSVSNEGGKGAGQGE